MNSIDLHCVNMTPSITMSFQLISMKNNLKHMFSNSRADSWADRRANSQGTANRTAGRTAGWKVEQDRQDEQQGG